jgi:hypothetical protein
MEVADQDRRWQETAVERTREWSQRILPPFLYPPPKRDSTIWEWRVNPLNSVPFGIGG